MEPKTRRTLGHIILIVTVIVSFIIWAGIWLLSKDLSVVDKQMAALNLLAFTLTGAVTLFVYELDRP